MIDTIATPSAAAVQERRVRRSRKAALASAVILGGLTSGVAAGSAAAATQTHKYARVDRTVLEANTVYGAGPYTAFKHELICDGSTPWWGHLYKKSSGGAVTGSTYGNCDGLVYSAGTVTVNWWCGNTTSSVRTGSCWVTKNI